MATPKNTAKTPDLKSKSTPSDAGAHPAIAAVARKAASSDAGAKTRAANTRAATRHNPAKIEKAPVSQHSAKDKEPVLVEVVDHGTAEAERAVEREEQERIDGVNHPPKVTEGPDSELQVHTSDPKFQHVQGESVG